MKEVKYGSYIPGVMKTNTNLALDNLSYRFINLEVSDRIAIVSLNNPPANRLSHHLLGELDNVIQALSENNKIKAIILCGNGKSFSCGADIEEMSETKTSGDAGDMSRNGQQIFMHIENCAKPVIAAISGFCLGGGLELALSCHICIASARSVFAMPEIFLGMVPAFGGSYRLPLKIGRERAIKMILSGEKINSEEALSIGLVSKIVQEEDLLIKAKALALKLTEKSAMTMRLALKSLIEGFGLTIEQAMDLEAKCVEELYDSHDLREGVFAYLEKRKPDFRDF